MMQTRHLFPVDVSLVTKCKSGTDAVMHSKFTILEMSRGLQVFNECKKSDHGTIQH